MGKIVLEKNPPKRYVILTVHDSDDDDGDYGDTIEGYDDVLASARFPERYPWVTKKKTLNTKYVYMYLDTYYCSPPSGNTWTVCVHI